MANFATILAVGKGSPVLKLFMVLLSNAIFTIMPGEHQRVRAVLKARGMSDAHIKKLRSSFWRKHCMYVCEPPQNMIPRIFELYCLVRTMKDPDNPQADVCTVGHEKIFAREIKYVQHGLLSDIPRMQMYRILSKIPGKLWRFRCLRSTSQLEGSFMHYHRSESAGAKACGAITMHVRSNLWDWFATVKAAQQANVIPRIGHPHTWKVDAIADTCRGFCAMPRCYRNEAGGGWVRTKTDRTPRTFRGVNFELLHLKEPPRVRGLKVDMSPLHSLGDISKVLAYPDLIINKDWPRLAKLTGVYTNAQCLDRLLKRCTDVGQALPMLKARGLLQLSMSLRAVAAAAIPPLAPIQAQQANTGVPGPLPAALAGPRLEGAITIVPPSCNASILPSVVASSGGGAAANYAAAVAASSAQVPKPRTAARAHQRSLQRARMDEDQLKAHKDDLAARKRKQRAAKKGGMDGDERQVRPRGNVAGEDAAGAGADLGAGSAGGGAARRHRDGGGGGSCSGGWGGRGAAEVYR